MRTTASMARPALCLAVAPVLLVGGAALARQEQQQPNGQRPVMAGKSKHFKNIQVLKNVPETEIIPIMRAFNTSLGVNCEFCHVEGPNHTGFELDTKPAKNAARGMIRMTQDMNKRYTVLGGPATCYMCHHGHPEPERRPPGQEEGGRREEGARRE